MPRDAFRSLFETNMGVRPGERILVFSDLIRPDETLSLPDRDRRKRLHAVAGEVAQHAQETCGNCSFVCFPATAASGAEPPEVLWRAALGETTVDMLCTEGILARLLTKTATTEDLVRARNIIMASPAAAQVIVALANNSTSHTRFRSFMNA